MSSVPKPSRKRDSLPEWIVVWTEVDNATSDCEYETTVFRFSDEIKACDFLRWKIVSTLERKEAREHHKEAEIDQYFNERGSMKQQYRECHGEVMDIFDKYNALRKDEFIYYYTIEETRVDEYLFSPGPEEKDDQIEE